MAFIIKEVKLEDLDTPKRIMALYAHIELFLKLWSDLVKSNFDEVEFLASKGQYISEKVYSKDLQIILRHIETLCICNLFTDSISLKKISTGILKSAYELLKVIDEKNVINPTQCVVNKIIPLRKLIMANRIESQNTLEESF
jgi:hypothetical protein